ncbi:MAG: hypothetical protein VX278_09335, partial [Myxococcota bacterium]|nr:hypothetical protein [Myxococcota bacterium]
MVSHTSSLTFKSITDIHKSGKSYNQSIDRLATGKRIDKGSDNSAALTVVKQQEADYVSLKMALNNITDGMNFVNSGEQSLGHISGLIDKMYDYALQSAQSTYSDEQRQNILNEDFKALAAEIERTATSASFRGVSILNNTDTNFRIHVGYRATSDDRISIDMTELQATTSVLGTLKGSTSLAAVASTGITTEQTARDALDVLKIAREEILEKRHFIAENYKKLESQMGNLLERKAASEQSISRIQDADYAAETSEA